MKVAAKWKIAALTLITWPAAIWLVSPNLRSPASRLLLLFAASPLFIAMGIELQGYWRQALKKQEQNHEVNPKANNAVVALLSLILFVFILWSIYSFVFLHT